MEKEIYDYWLKQAALGEQDEVDALRKVLDPQDRKGVKNSYIDCHLKYHLREHLRPSEQDTVLEIGCGIGRLVEYLSPSVRLACGIDIADEFIERCNLDPRKRDNTRYFKADQVETLKEMGINKMYIVWVLMYLTEKSELITVLKRYRESLPELSSASVIEQVKSVGELATRRGEKVCCYRTIGEYVEIFEAAGFRVAACHILGERRNGPLYRIIHLTCNLLPRSWSRFAERLFFIDRRLMGERSAAADLVNPARPTDVLFSLEVA